MASVQSPPMAQHQGAPLPAGATKQQAEEIFNVRFHHIDAHRDHYASLLIWLTALPTEIEAHEGPRRAC